MARVTLTPVEPDENGLNPDPMEDAVVDGHYFEPMSGRFEVELDNTAGGVDRTVTVPTPFVGGVNQLADNDLLVQAGTRLLFRIKPAELQFYLQTNPDTGQTRSVIFLNYDAITNLKVQVRHFL